MIKPTPQLWLSALQGGLGLACLFGLALMLSDGFRGEAAAVGFAILAVSAVTIVVARAIASVCNSGRSK